MRSQSSKSREEAVLFIGSALELRDRGYIRKLQGSGQPRNRPVRLYIQTGVGGIEPDVSAEQEAQGSVEIIESGG